MKKQKLKALVLLLIIGFNGTVNAEELKNQQIEVMFPLLVNYEELSAFGYSALINQLDFILEEAINSALKSQSAELNLANESESLYKSRSFWKQVALTEGLVIASALITGLFVYKVTE